MVFWWCTLRPNRILLWLWPFPFAQWKGKIVCTYVFLPSLPFCRQIGCFDHAQHADENRSKANRKFYCHCCNSPAHSVATQILREINFKNSWSLNTAIFTISETLNFNNLVDFSPQKWKKNLHNQNSELPKVPKWQFF